MVSTAPRRALGMSQSSMTVVAIKQPWMTAIQPSSMMVTQASPSPPHSLQQKENGVYQAFTRQWCFTQVPGLIVGVSVSVSSSGAVGGMVIQ